MAPLARPLRAGTVGYTAGSMQAGVLLAGELTRRETAYASICAAGYGASIAVSWSMRWFCGSSHCACRRAGTMTGMRSWTGSTSALAVVVMIVHEVTGSPSGDVQRS